MNTNIKSLSIGLASLLLFLASCRKSKSNTDDLNNNNTELKSDVELLKLYNFTSTPLDGKFSFNSTGYFGSQSFSRSNNFSGTFHNSAHMGNAQPAQRGNLLKLGSEIIVPTVDNIYEKPLEQNAPIWGSTMPISLQATSSSPVLTSNFRIPKLLIVEGHNPNFTQTLGLNGKIRTNVDNENAKGVLITIEYQPAYNDSLRLAGYTETVRNAEVQKDDGSIEMTANLFQNIPNKCSYKVTVGRVNFQIIESTDGKKYGVYAYVYLSNFYNKP